MTYVDNNATTKIAAEVLEAMEPYLAESYGNPSSIHQLGQEAKKALDKAREKIATFLKARHPSEIIFTSGGTESNNFAIRGILKSDPSKRRLITTKVEHPSVLNVFKALEKEGYQVSYLNVDSEGCLDLNQLRNELSSHTALVSIMYANNETGAIFPVEEIGQWVKESGAFFHVDAVQAVGRISISLQESPIDLLSLSGHKLHAPKGVGALFAKKGIPLSPWIVGGSQERERRGGTENVASIVGLGEACELADHDFLERNQRLAFLRDKLEEGIMAQVSGVLVNGNRKNRVSNTTNLSFQDLDAESILLALDGEGICASSGSACSTGSTQLSHVLLAMDYPEERVRGAIRFSLGRYNQEAEMDLIIQKMSSIVHRLREVQTSEV